MNSKLIKFLMIMFVLPFTLFCMEERDIPDFIKKCVEDGHTPGMVVGCIDKDGIRFYKYGHNDIEKTRLMDEYSVFEMGSITKIFTAILLSEMVYRGDVRSDDPLDMYINEFKVPDYRGQKITLEHLATHKGGFPYLPTNFVTDDLYNPFAKYQVQDLYDFMDSYYMPYAPGTQYQYSNICIVLLGAALSNKMGISFNELLAQRLFIPLGMDSTRIRLTKEMEEKYSDAHIRTKKVSHWNIDSLEGAGGLRSCAHDMANFVAANLDLIKTDLFPILFDATISRGPQDLPKLDVGLEWNISKRYSPKIIYHGGITGGHQTFVGFCPEKEMGIVVMSNSSSHIADFGKHILNPKWEVRKDRRQSAVFPLIMQQFEGEYKNGDARTTKIHYYALGHMSYLAMKIGYYPEVKLFAESDVKYFIRNMPVDITFKFDENHNVIGCDINQDGKVHFFKKIK